MKITLRKLLNIIEIDNDNYIDVLYVDGEFVRNNFFIEKDSEYMDYIVEKYEVEKEYAHMEMSVISTTLRLKSKGAK